MDNNFNNYNGFNHDYGSFNNNYGYQQNENFDNRNMHQGDYQNLPGYEQGDVVPFNPLAFIGNGIQYMSDTIQDVIPFNPLTHMQNAGVGIKEKISNIFSGFVANARHLVSSVVSNRLFKVAVVVVAVGLIVTGVALVKTVLTIGCIVLAVLLAKRIFDAVSGR